MINLEIDDERVYQELVEKLANLMIYRFSEKFERDMYLTVRDATLVVLRKKAEEVLVDYTLSDGRTVRDVIEGLLKITGGKHDDRSAVLRTVDRVLATEAERIVREVVEPHAHKLRVQVGERIASLIGLEIRTAMEGMGAVIAGADNERE